MIVTYRTMSGGGERVESAQEHAEFDDGRGRWAALFIQFAANDDCDHCRPVAASLVLQLASVTEDALPWTGELEGDDYVICRKGDDRGVEDFEGGEQG